jgi:hypothetical protein
MVIEAVLWALAAVVAPLAGAWLLARPETTWPGRIARKVEASGAAAWVYGLGFTYAALLRGAILPREAGLSGHSLPDWAAGLLITAVVCLAVPGAARLAGRLAALRRWLAPVSGGQASATGGPVEGILEESRWALYRGLGGYWTASPWGWGMTGLVLALTEMGLRGRVWHGPRAWAARRAAYLGHAVLSFLLFGLTRNAWLAAIGFVICQAVWLGASVSLSEPEGGEEGR